MAHSSTTARPSTFSYAVVFVVLMLLLAATVALDQFNFGIANTWLAMGISVAKAVLILLFFMHLKGSVPLIQVTGFAALLWLAIAVTLTMGDYETRGWGETQSGGLEPDVALERTATPPRSEAAPATDSADKQ